VNALSPSAAQLQLSVKIARYADVNVDGNTFQESFNTSNVPRYSCQNHLLGHAGVSAPYIVAPPGVSDNTALDRTAVNANADADVGLRRVAQKAAKERDQQI
jgi:hypothetical protein